MQPAIDFIVQYYYIIIVVIIVIIALLYYNSSKVLNGVWEGHADFLDDAGLIKYILIIDDNKGSLFIQNDNGIIFNDKIELSISGGYLGWNIVEYSIAIKPLPTEDYKDSITLRLDKSKGLMTLKNKKVLAELYKDLESTDLIND